MRGTLSHVVVVESIAWVVDQTQALNTLKSKGVRIRLADLAFLSPYATSKLKRFGDYPTSLTPEKMPTCTNLPQ